ncbi:transcriptional regulator [Spiroplasma sp. NBRC 100390]|uniref:MurR/RpiR family transcriptional regulator n=1 Tax=unclassified Spiroplasma TaxID=2637901 RepID=UPI0008929CD7|nr:MULTISPECIES: MurR/RpiR family transcriptional regulator [unclassified Spiroplasma]AOX44199.1 transcriptional regulator [Spiroplasma sp. TU-14]APE13669.1 transcriptional regulator [Spiroplasma sp. NBRC 100390]
MLSLLTYDKTNLTDTELSVIEQIIKNPLLFTSKTISELAKAYYVSESTITRMAKHLGFRNIKELQMHIYERLNFLNKNYETNETMKLKDIANNMRVYYSYSIHETIDNIDLDALDRLINDIVIKKRIFAFGIGSSFLACRVLHSNLNMIGYNCFTTESIHSLMVTMQNVDEDDLIIIFSKSGKTNEIINVITLANKLGIDVALVTNNPNADQLYNIKHKILFEVHTKENERFPALSSKIVQILISDIIFRSLLKIHPNLEEKIKAANAITEEYNKGAIKK